MVAHRSQSADQGKVWTIAEAKAKLSEILRMAESEGPQRIGVHKGFVVVPEDVWLEREKSEREEEQIPMGQWLLERMPRGMYSEIPRADAPERPPFYADWTEEEWAALDAANLDDS